MPYFAAVLGRAPQRWTGREVDLDGLETLDEVAEIMRDAAVDDELVLLFVEEDEEWFAILRVDGVADPRVFISDVRAPLDSDLAGLLYVEADVEAETDEDRRTRTVAGEPGGDLELLEDLGVAADELVALTAGEGLLPADVISAIAESLGFTSELDKLR